MPQRPDKWIRSIKENPSGKVVADQEGNRWEWETNDETSRLLKKLSNDELAIESTDLRRVQPQRQETRDDPLKRASRRPKAGARDSGGGFDPYDHAGKPKRR